jgi:hypothetical protein
MDSVTQIRPRIHANSLANRERENLRPTEDPSNKPPPASHADHDEFTVFRS